MPQSPTYAEQRDELHESMAEQAPPELLHGFASAATKLDDVDFAGRAPQVGAVAPDFALSDQAQAEIGTIAWYAARTSPTTFWIFDTFPTEDARRAHVNAEIAAALMANADELLATAPEILPADVLAAK